MRIGVRPLRKLDARSRDYTTWAVVQRDVAIPHVLSSRFCHDSHFVASGRFWTTYVCPTSAYPFVVEVAAGCDVGAFCAISAPQYLSKGSVRGKQHETSIPFQNERMYQEQ